ncbi:hypothetical protein BaRGS_00003602 [Batillaria attramentaria]|uniref:BTB domain-containing protein n=1 Tax=Batillaria attramentaria TaxID=370345 RepID=A0ABD0M1C8_9CAEN
MAEEQQPKAVPVLFATPDDMTDVIFVVEDRKLYFNKTILMMCSPVFKSMFTSSFKEKEAKEIPLPDKKYGDVVVFFEQIHPMFTQQPITDTTLAQILPLADEYQVKPVLQKCGQYLLAQIKGVSSSSLTTDKVLFYLWLCEKHLQEHRDTFLHLAARRKSRELQTSCNYELLPQTTMLELITTRCLKLDDFIFTEGSRTRYSSDLFDRLRHVCRHFVCSECNNSLTSGLEKYLNK